MSLDDEIKFLILIRNKLDKVVSKISIREPVIECVAMLTDRIKKLQEEKGKEGVSG